MATENTNDNGAVYMVFNNIFKGQDAQIRKLASIKRLVTKHQKEPLVAQLLEEYSAPIIYEKLKRLLGDHIFESTLKAKDEFPELFEVSRAQSAERAISEAEATEGHAKAVEEALAFADSYGLSYNSDYDSGPTGTDPEAEESVAPPTKQQSAHFGTGIPSLFPLEFEFTTGHKILIKTQEVLELACFRFAESAMPEILEKRKWYCPESAELNLWSAEFAKRLKKFGKMSSKNFSPLRPLEELFPSIAQIRHHAVHRIPVTAKELEHFMADGETLMQLFEDKTATAVMSRARSEIRKAAVEMENRKNMLEARLAKVLQDVAAKRAELDQIEMEAIADMQQKDKEYQLFAGDHLQDTIWLDDGAIRQANELDNDCLVDRVASACGSDVRSYEEHQIRDVLEEGSISSASGATIISDTLNNSLHL